MLLPGLLGPGLLQLLQVPQLGVELVHPVGLGLVGHVVLLQQLAGGLTGAESLNNLEEFKLHNQRMREVMTKIKTFTSSGQ